MVWQSGDGNACWSACCCPERGEGVGLKEVWQLEPLVIEDWWENIIFKLPPQTCSSSINRRKWHKKRNHTFYSKGHLNRKNGFHQLLLPPHVENTLVSIRLKEVLPILHLSLPIVNSVDPFLLRVKMPVFVYLLVSLFVHACQPRSRERNECLWAIRPVGEDEEEEKIGEGEWRTERENPHWSRDRKRIDPVVWVTLGSKHKHSSQTLKSRF